MVNKIREKFKKSNGEKVSKVVVYEWLNEILEKKKALITIEERMVCDPNFPDVAVVKARYLKLVNTQ